MSHIGSKKKEKVPAAPILFFFVLQKGRNNTYNRTTFYQIFVKIHPFIMPLPQKPSLLCLRSATALQSAT